LGGRLIIRGLGLLHGDLRTVHAALRSGQLLAGRRRRGIALSATLPSRVSDAGIDLADLRLCGVKTRLGGLQRKIGLIRVLIELVVVDGEQRIPGVDIRALLHFHFADGAVDLRRDDGRGDRLDGSGGAHLIDETPLLDRCRGGGICSASCCWSQCVVDDEAEHQRRDDDGYDDATDQPLLLAHLALLHEPAEVGFH
jgi:hypothetical protein